MIYLELFIRFLIIGICSFGGGYAAMPMIQNQIVDDAGWMTEMQFADIVSISEMTPGPIMLNAATFVGEQIAGFGGALVATFASMLPSIVIISIVARLYFNAKNTDKIKSLMFFARPAVCALILSAAVNLIRVALLTDSWIMVATGLPVDIWSLVMMGISFALLKKFKMSPVLVILLSGAVGAVVYNVIPGMI